MKRASLVLLAVVLAAAACAAQETVMDDAGGAPAVARQGERILSDDAGQPRTSAGMLRYDLDGDGIVTLEEWRRGRSLFSLCDVNGNGVLDEAEIAAAAQMIEESAIVRTPPGFTECIDRNRDGYIQRDEWMGGPGVFEIADIDADEQLDETELAAAIRGMHRIMQSRPQADRSGESLAYEPPSVTEREGAARTARPGTRGPIPGIEGEASLVGSVFGMLDANRDGQVSQREYGTFLAEMGRADADGDGYVTLREARMAVREAASAQRARAFMRYYDENGDGRIERSEFEGPDEAFGGMDRNGDGALTPDDRWWAAPPPSAPRAMPPAPQPYGGPSVPQGRGYEEEGYSADDAGTWYYEPGMMPGTWGQPADKEDEERGESFAGPR